MPAAAECESKCCLRVELKADSSSQNTDGASYWIGLLSLRKCRKSLGRYANVVRIRIQNAAFGESKGREVVGTRQCS